MNADGTNARQVTTLGMHARQVAWSPDGTRIAFSAFGNADSVYVVGVDGKNPATIGFGRQPSWSPDGSQVAFADSSQIGVVNADGTSWRLFEGFNGIEPAWSPDGTRIAYSSGAGIWLMNADGTNRVQISSIGEEPAWSPDGKRIAFEWWGVIYVMSSSGTNQVRLTAGGSSIDTFPSWSPDGTKITFARYGAGQLQVWTMDADGTNQAAVATGWDPSWGP